MAAARFEDHIAALVVLGHPQRAIQANQRDFFAARERKHCVALQLEDHAFDSTLADFEADPVPETRGCGCMVCHDNLL
jgi:hypothetical protein